MNRRQFIQASGLAAVGAAIAIPGFSRQASRKVGLQLYTVRDIVTKDPKGVLKQIADIGYQELETFGYSDGKIFGLSFKEFADYARSLGLKITSGHYAYGKTERMKAVKGTLLNDWEHAVSDAKEIGQEFMVVPYLVPDERTSLDDYKFLCEKLNEGALVCKKYGIKLNYHNHDFEFIKFGETMPYDLMLAQLDPKLVDLEIDLFWTVYANQDPLAYFAKYPGRFPQWHIKEMDKEVRKQNVNIGTGQIDFKSYFAKAKEAGLKHFYMEADTYPAGTTSVDMIKGSVAYMKTL